MAENQSDLNELKQKLSLISTSKNIQPAVQKTQKEKLKELLEKTLCIEARVEKL